MNFKKNFDVRTKSFAENFVCRTKIINHSKQYFKFQPGHILNNVLNLLLFSAWMFL